MHFPSRIWQSAWGLSEAWLFVLAAFGIFFVVNLELDAIALEPLFSLSALDRPAGIAWLLFRLAFMAVPALMLWRAGQEWSAGNRDGAWLYLGQFLMILASYGLAGLLVASGV